MRTLQRLAAISDATAKLTAQLRELNQLREQVRKAEQFQRSRRREPRSQPTPAAQQDKILGPKIAADKSKELCLPMRVSDERDQANYQFQDRRVFFRT